MYNSARWRRRDSNDLATLIGALGGNASVPALYDVRSGLTVSGGVVSQWDDARGATGFSPSLTASTTARPTYDATNRLVVFDGVANVMTTAAASLFDLTGAMSLFVVAAMPVSAATVYSVAIAESSSAVRLMGLRQTATGAGVFQLQKNGSGGGQTLASTVLPSATRRLAIGSKDNNVAGAIDVPSQARVSGNAAGNIAAGNNQFSLGNFFPGVAGTFGAPSVRAAGVLARQATASDIATLLAWAQSIHGAVAA